MSTTNGGERPIPNSYWVKLGCLAAGEYPGEVDPKEAAAKLRDLLQAGIDHFIDLTEEGERTDQGELVPYRGIAEEEGRKLGLDVRWTRHPIRDTRVPDNPQDMATILAAIDSALANGRKVYVHCWGGAGRTGTVIGCWLVRHGRAGDEALDQIAEWWRGVAKAHFNSRSPNEWVQREYVRNWEEPTGEEQGP